MTNSVPFSCSLSFLFLVFALSLPLISSQLCNHADMNTLLSIKNSFGNPSELDSWNSARAADCCSSWRGVGCGPDGRITSVGVFYSNASGPIPSSIGDLSALTIINFFNLPNLVGPIPLSITKLTSLTQITISRTSLAGSIPSFLSNLKNLYYLDLSGNKLTGEIPKSFGDVKFKTINLYQNKLTGDGSILFGVRPYSVDKINLSWNELEFDLSRVEFPLSLVEIDLSHNKIGGSIPTQITRLQKLKAFDVSYNLLCGAIPKIRGFENQVWAFEHNKCLCGAPLSPCKRHPKF